MYINTFLCRFIFRPQTSYLRPQTSYLIPHTSDLRPQTSDLRPHMPYFVNKHILFIHIPKTGGTAIEEALLKNDNIILHSLGKRSNTLFPEKKLMNISLQHQVYGVLEKYSKLCGIQMDNELRIISVLRNPYNKVISDLLYINWITKESTQDDVYNNIRQWVIQTPEATDNHNVLQYLFLINKMDEIDKKITLFRNETLTSEFNEYFKKENIVLEQQHIKDYSHMLNDNSIALINKVYRKDFEYFGYPMKTTSIA